MILLAQLFRIIGSICGITADKSISTKKIFIFNGLQNIFNGIQYFLLGAITGGITSLLAVARNVLFYKYKVNIISLLLYFVVLFLFSYPSIDGFISILPILFVILYSSALYSKNVKAIKYAVVIECAFEIIYDYYYHAYVGIFVCILDIVLVLLSLIKMKNVEQVMA